MGVLPEILIFKYRPMDIIVLIMSKLIDAVFKKIRYIYFIMGWNLR
jgi:hypothetical protein